MVSGRRDCGMVAVVQTMVCQDCEQLVDVLIGRCGQDGPTGDPDYDVRLGRCPDCGGHDVRPWDNEHLCPRCNRATMQQEGFQMLWD